MPTVRIDNRPPTVVAFYIEDDAAYVAQVDVTLQLNAVDGSPPVQVQLSNDGTSWSAWQALAPSVPWTLATGDGPKEVWARLRDSRGNATTTQIKDTVILSTAAPQVTGVIPADGANSVNPASVISILFSQAMDSSTLTPSTVQLWRDADATGTFDALSDVQVSTQVDYDPFSRSVAVRTTSGLSPDTQYFIRVLGYVASQSGLPMGSEAVSSFLTGAISSAQPVVLSVTPPTGSSAVIVTTEIATIFDREMNPASLEKAVLLVAVPTGTPVPGRVEQDPSDPRRVVFVPSHPLSVSTTYMFTVGAAARDYAGVPLGQEVSSTFTTAEVGVSPHGVYNAGSGICGLCHSTHEAARPSSFGLSLLQESLETDLCYTCHNGTGARTNVQSAFSMSGSGHVIEDVVGTRGPGLTSRCSSCHDPHGLARTSPSLHRATIKGTAITGNDHTWCEACHNDTFDWAVPGYPYPAGGIDASKPFRGTDGYPELGTFPGATVFNDTLNNAHNPSTSGNVVWPGSGLPSGDCRNCHAGHRNASPRDALSAQYRPTPDVASVLSDRQTGTYAELCLTCHDADGPAQSDIKTTVTYEADLEGADYTSGHRIMTAGGTLPVGAPLPCYDCHNPHGSAGNDGSHPNRDLISDERWSGIDTGTTAGEVRFCLQCHLPSEYVNGSGKPEAGSVPAGQATHVEGLDRRDSSNKLSLPGGISAHGKDNLATPGLRCSGCHGNDYGAPADDSGYNVHRPRPTGGCVGCHSQAQVGWAFTRRAVVDEFGGAAHHVQGSLVSDEDCGVCHLERDAVTNGLSDIYHANEVIDLRDPDTGLSLAPFGRLVRDTESNVLEAEALVVQDGLCLKCHDADGAASQTARAVGGTALRPFSANSADAADINGPLDPANAFTHPVRAAGSNPYTSPSESNGGVVTMKPPWNQSSGSHNVITCFDCHVTTAGHGGTFQDAGRTDFGTPAGQRQLCLGCHASLVYEGESEGSRFSDHGESAHRLDGGNSQGCRGCHAGTVDRSGLTVSNGAPGNIHGGSFIWPAGTQTPGVNTLHFIYGGWLSGWDAGTCYGGQCHHSSGQQY
ncbi:MAG: Ig-like domain-containing protein [Thermoleophilia bacterium]|nr:Ig-like domain-containing protein [Thermoleophilia bacterium]